MVIVETAALRPAQCMFTKSAEGPFIDLLRDFDFDHDGRMYMRLSFAAELGRMAGLVDPPGEEDVSEVELLRARVAELEDELAEADGVIDAIDVIESRDFRARKRPGRRPNKKQVENELEEAA